MLRIPCFVVGLVWTALAGAQPVQWPAGAGGNDHYYEFVVAPNIKWTDADAAARLRSFHGVSGYLATITSAAENAFMADNFSAEAGPFQDGWLGGYQDTTAPDYSEPAGGWRWVSGEPWAYTNWFSGIPHQPDDDGGNQNYLRSNVNFQWDDLENVPSSPALQLISGYFVEYPIPEPAAPLWLALAAGVAGPRPRSPRW